MSVILEKYINFREEKGSILCLGLDPATPEMGGGMPESYFDTLSDSDAIARFCLDIIDETADSCCAVKMNAQYTFPLLPEHYESINKSAHEKGMLSILDVKLGDIGSSNDALLFWAKKVDFDAITFSPFAGNIKETVKKAHLFGIGVFVLTLMSNPEAVYFMREARIEGKKGYEWIAEQAGLCSADGVVVGATNTTEDEFAEIRELVGENCIILVPGVGAQGGDAERAIKFGGENIMINVGRAIIYDKSPAEAAEKYKNNFNRIRWGIEK
ncbi:MAG: orotidine-5'-phosphate decarboxylase [Candidatus Micrarchaeia archaeon]